MTYDLEELERLEKLATKGPWLEDHGIIPPDGPGTYADIYTSDETIVALYNNEISAGQANAALIVTTRNALPSLLAAAKENERLREIVKLYVDPMNVRPEDEEMVRRALEGETP